MSRKYYDRLVGGSAVATTKKFHSDFGASILKKFGWSQGEGLGKERLGTVDPVIVSKRTALSGLGTEKEKKEGQWNNWWEDLYNTTAQKIQCAPRATTEGPTEPPAVAADTEKERRKRKKAEKRCRKRRSDQTEDGSEASTRVSEAEAPPAPKKEKKRKANKSEQDLAFSMSKAKRQKGKLERLKNAEQEFLEKHQPTQTSPPS